MFVFLFILAWLSVAIDTLTPEQRSLRGRIAANTRWSREDGKPNAVRAQAGLRRKFYDETDPSLPEAERRRRADAAYRAHMARLSFAASKARARKAAGGTAA